MVPAVEYNNKALYESLVLCEFFEDAYPNHTPALLPADPFLRAYARIWIDHITKTFIPSLFRLIQTQPQDKEKQDSARDDVYTSLKKFSNEIKGPYFLGEEFSLVDIAIAPWIVRDYIVVEHRGFKREEVGEVYERYARIVEKRDSVLNTQSVRIIFFAHVSIDLHDVCRTRSTTPRFTVVTCAMKPKVRLLKPLGLGRSFREYQIKGFLNVTVLSSVTFFCYHQEF